MMIKIFAPLLAIVLLAGCSAVNQPPQKAQKAKASPLHSLEMESLCKNQAAHRYNTAAQKIDVTGFEQFQGSYELQGFTARNEGFVCSFDPDGQFLHLSMR
ncbi:YsaB family lipoprotein [Yokenella regensburgei]|uniref:YsaB family lipoprotein n=1 Tax=Yokenella regensburgei TaxID=158877 RepID=UPI003EDA406A